MMSNVLIYGFGPFKDYKTNITANIVNEISKIDGVITKIFDVQFCEQMFLEQLELFKPNFIIGLGQSHLATSMQIERCAKNEMCFDSKADSQTIETNALDSLTVSLDLALTSECTISEDAGNYVCNYSMWVIESWSRKNNAKFAFIHIPIDYDVNIAVKYISEQIQNLKNSIKI